MTERQPIYPHDLASVPVAWVDIAQPDGFGMVAVRKQHTIYQVSQEFLEDYGPEIVFGLLRPQTWRDRERRAIRDARLDRRLGYWWQSLDLRRRLAQRIYPEGEWA